MKQLLLFIVISLLLTQHAYSQSCCQDMIENQWAKEHIAEIKNMSRKDLVTMTRPMQVAVWQYFSAQQKYAAWKDKLAETKRMDWSEQEMKHIERMESYMDKHKEAIFGSDSKREKDIMNKFVKKWTTYAHKHLGWTLSLCSAIGCTLYQLDGKTGKVILPSEKEYLK